VAGDCGGSGEWGEPVVGRWPVELREDRGEALTTQGLHKSEIWTARHGAALAEWPIIPVDPFFNVNTPQDAAEAERIAARHRDL